MSLGRLARDLPHLARRLAGHVRARRLTPGEQDWVEAHLRPPERALFWGQAVQDQRHAHDTARDVARRLEGDAAAIRAGLLHDVGKRHVTIGPVARSVATVLEAFRVPLPAPWRAYREHGRLGADDLEAAGSEPIVVAFARSHPGPGPPGVDPGIWQVLLDADAR